MVSITFSFFSCKEETENMPRLFKPVFIASKCYAEENNILLSWRISSTPTSYTVEVSKDATFEMEPDATVTVVGGNCIVEGLKYETPYYVRVKANNDIMNINSNWSVYTSAISTQKRVIPKLLCSIEEESIGKDYVDVEWIQDENKNPVDGVVYWTEEEKLSGADGKKRSFTSDEIAVGMARIDGLSPRTVYYVMLVNSQSEDGPIEYNEQCFRTFGDYENAVEVMDGKDLFERIQTDMADDTKTELIYKLKNGVKYYLNSKGDISGSGKIELNASKSISFVADKGEHPVLYTREGGLYLNGSLTIDYITLENVDFAENIDFDNGGVTKGTKTYFLSAEKKGETNKIGRVEFINSKINLAGALIFVGKSGLPKGSNITIENIKIDNCILKGINDSKNAGAAVALIHAPNAGCNVWNNVSVTNSTFFSRDVTYGLFGQLAETAVPGIGKIEVTNCTFYKYGNNSKQFSLGDFSNVANPFSISVTNCLFGEITNGKVFLPGSSNVETNSNYCTNSYANAANAGIPLVLIEMTDDDLFEDTANGNFTIKDVTSVPYTQGIGDPRWIKINK